MTKAYTHYEFYPKKRLLNRALYMFKVFLTNLFSLRRQIRNEDQSNQLAVHPGIP